MQERRASRRALLCGACGAATGLLVGCSDPADPVDASSLPTQGGTTGPREVGTTPSGVVPTGATTDLTAGSPPIPGPTDSSYAGGASGGSGPSPGADPPSPTDRPTSTPSTSAPSSSAPSSSAPSSPGTPSPTVSATTGAPPGYLGPTSEVPVGGGVVYAGRDVVVTQPTSGRFVGMSATCPHQGREVGAVTGGVVECGYHGSLFSIEDGSVVQGPATSGLVPRSIYVEAGDLYQG